jgi:chromate transport protein ChrA
MVLLCAWAYKTYGALPQAQAILYGVKPVIIAIVARAIFGLARTAVKNLYYVGLGIAALMLALLGVDVLVLLFACGALVATVYWLSQPKGQSPSGLLWVYGNTVSMIALPDALTRLNRNPGPTPYSPLALFAFFLKVGLTLYGGGYVLIAFLRDGLVHQWHWLTEAQHRGCHRSPDRDIRDFPAVFYSDCPQWPSGAAVEAFPAGGRIPRWRERVGTGPDRRRSHLRPDRSAHFAMILSWRAHSCAPRRDSSRRLVK